MAYAEDPQALELSEAEVIATMEVVDEIARGLTGLALMWLWSHPDPSWRDQNRSGL